MDADLEALEYDELEDLEAYDYEDFDEPEDLWELDELEAYDYEGALEPEELWEFDELEAYDYEDTLEPEELWEFDELEAYEYEDAFEPEEVWELDDLEYGEYEDWEADPFFGFIKRAFKKVGSWIKRGARALAKGLGSIFKKLAPIAARIVGGTIGGPAGSLIGGAITKAVLGEAAYESEAEAEADLFESEHDFEEEGGDFEAFEDMEIFSAEAAEAESEAEADMSIAHMIRAGARMFRANPRLRRTIPRVLRAAAALAKTFRANRRTRWAIRVIPVIVRRTLTRLARIRRITRRAIVQAMAREVAWVFANRRRAMAALRRHRVTRRGGRQTLRVPRRPGRRIGRRRVVRPSYFVM